GADPACDGSDLDRLRRAPRGSERLEVQDDEGDVEAVAPGQHDAHRRASLVITEATCAICSPVMRDVTGTATRLSASASARGQAARPKPAQAWSADAARNPKLPVLLGTPSAASA